MPRYTLEDLLELYYGEESGDEAAASVLKSLGPGATRRFLRLALQDAREGLRNAYKLNDKEDIEYWRWHVATIRKLLRQRRRDVDVPELGAGAGRLEGLLVGMGVEPGSEEWEESLKEFGDE